MSLFLLKIQLSGFQGPLITISPKGVKDHFNQNVFLKWNEVQLIEFKSHEGYAYSFKVLPKSRSFKYFLLKALGRTPFQYNEEYLSVSSDAISQYIRNVGPSGILK